MNRAALLFLLLAACGEEPGACSAVGGGAIGGSIGDGAIGGGVFANVGGTSLLFDLNPNGVGSGPANLASTITVNGTTLTPTVECDARNISGTNWTCTGSEAPTLAEAGAGASPTVVAAPFTETGARAAFYSDTKYHQAATIGVADVTTDDVIIEAIVMQGGNTNDVAASKGDSGGGFTGFQIYRVGSTYNLDWGSGASFATGVTPGAMVVPGQWIHLLGFFKHNSATGIQLCGNGSCGTQVTTAAVGSKAAATGKLEIGERSVGGLTSRAKVALFREWKCTGCLATTENAAIALDRFQRLMGLQPSVAAAPIMTYTRASGAVVDIDRDSDGVRLLFTVANGWPRVAKRLALSGGLYLSGYLSEQQSTNLALQSQTLDNASWTKVNVTVTADTTAAPDLTTTADSILQVASAGTVAHCITQAPTLTASIHSAAVFLKASTRTQAYINDSTIANGAAWINLATCAAGTVQAGVSQAVGESYGSGWCRFNIVFSGTAAAHTIQICSANADNATTYDGGAGTATQIIAWGAQVEQVATATSYIATTTATVTRVLDNLSFAGSNAVSAHGGMVTRIMGPNVEPPWGTLYTTLVGTNANNYMICRGTGSAGAHGSTFYGAVLAGTDTLGLATTPTGYSSPATEVSDQLIHTIACSWSSGRYRMWVDRTQTLDANPPSPNQAPPAISAVTIGYDPYFVASSNGWSLIGRVETFSSPNEPVAQ